MVKALLFPLVAGIVCLALAVLLRIKFGAVLDLYLFGIYFVVSAKMLLITGLALFAVGFVILLVVR